MSVSQHAQLKPWLESAWQLFSAYKKQQRIPQALLITGIKGLGKYELALQFAQSLLCSEPLADGFYCNQCHACHLFKVHTHPDVIQPQPEENATNIGIDIIRHLISQLNIKPQYHGYRVVIFESAHLINHAAANGFLKCLEEPAENNIIILVTEKPGMLPATISSRCQKFPIKTPQQKVALKWLQQQGVKDQQLELLNLAQGAPILALQYANQQIIATRKHCFKQWQEIFSGQTTPCTVATEWQKLHAEQIITWLTSWVLDMIKYYYHKDNAFCYNPDFRQPLQALSQQLDLKKLYLFYDLLLVSKKRAHTQLNKQLMFEEILINWSHTSSRS